jgi:DNA invertase Pin-like site-specific DNA recombinase
MPDHCRLGSGDRDRQRLARRRPEFNEIRQGSSARSFSSLVSLVYRAQLHLLLKTIDPGDVMIVTSLDRLARSTRDLLNILDKIAKAGATFKSLGDAWATRPTDD